MSFKLGLNRVQEVLVLGLMLVSVFALFYSEIEFTYKIGIIAIVFSVVLLTSLANQILQQEEKK